MKVLYLTNGMASSLLSGLELGRRLAAAGHRVTFASQADVAPQVEAEGFPFVALTADRDFVQRSGDQPLSWRGLRAPAAFARAWRRRRAIRRDAIGNDEIERTVHNLAPDRLLIDVELHFAVLATAALAVPTLLPSVFFSLFRRPGLPPLHTGLMPPATPRQRLAVRLAWWRSQLSARHLAWRARLARLGRCDLAPPVTYDTLDVDDLRAVARHRAFPWRRAISRADWLRPYMYRRLPVLCFNAWEMELPHARHPNLHYVGPMVPAARRETRVDEKAAASWRVFRARRARDGAARPLVYASLGTVWRADVDFLRRVVAVFERRRDWDLVLGLGGRLDAARLAPLPPNVLALAWAPQLEVLAAADCAIVHGGVTSLNECVRLGVPMAVYSTGFVDQDGCAARVGYHGLGVLGDRERDGPAEIEANLERALGDREIGSRLEAMRATVRGYERSAMAVELVERAPELCAAAAGEAPAAEPGAR